MYYYRAYSYDNSEEYSAPRASSAQTLMAPVSPSAASLGSEYSGSLTTWANGSLSIDDP